MIISTIFIVISLFDKKDLGYKIIFKIFVQLFMYNFFT